MKTIFNVSLIFISLWFLMAGSANADGQPDIGVPTSAWQGKTILPRNENTEELVLTANDSAKSEAARAQAIFSLFAYQLHSGLTGNGLQLHPGVTSKIAHAIFKDTAWLRNSNIRPIRVLAGLIPVNWPRGDTIFSVNLFSDAIGEQWSPWSIYLHFSGELQDGDALAFFSDTNPYQNTNLVEFALCFPDGRIERFSKDGILVFPAHDR